MNDEHQNIVLIGMPGVGKTTLGALLAERMGRNFYDSDAILTEKLGAVPSRLIEDRGEVYFRHKEALVVNTLLRDIDVVIALGSGAVLDEDALHALRKQFVIWLMASPDTLLERSSLHGDNKAELLKIQYEKRSPLYEAVCTCQVNIDHKTPEILLEELSTLIGMND